MKITQNCELFSWPLQLYGHDSLKVLDVKVVNYWVSMLFGGTVCFTGISVQLNTCFQRYSPIKYALIPD